MPAIRLAREPHTHLVQGEALGCPACALIRPEVMTRRGLQAVRFVPDFAEQQYGAPRHPNPRPQAPVRPDWLLRLHPLHPASDLADLAAALPDGLIDLWRSHVADPSPLPRRGPEDWGPREA